jgi:hypothetical protein
MLLPQLTPVIPPTVFIPMVMDDSGALNVAKGAGGVPNGSRKMMFVMRQE